MKNISRIDDCNFYACFRLSLTTQIKVFDVIFYFIILTMVFGIGYDIHKRINNRFDPSQFGRIDWHDWNLIEAEKLRTGIGEHGEPAHLSFYPPDSKDINETVGYNGYLSDKIALDRSLKDLRPPG